LVLKPPCMTSYSSPEGNYPPSQVLYSPPSLPHPISPLSLPRSPPIENFLDSPPDSDENIQNNIDSDDDE
jgi:hypothetical protein